MTTLFNCWLVRALIALRTRCVWVKMEHRGRVQWLQCRKTKIDEEGFKLNHYDRQELVHHSFWDSYNGILALEDYTPSCNTLQS